MTPETDITCYRHPSRVTGLRCTECDRPICTECSIEAAVGQRCPECVARSGRQKTVTASSLGRGNASTAPMTYGFIAVAAVIFAVGLFDSGLRFDLLERLALINAAVIDGEWYRLFTVTLLHGSLIHILFNMYALSILGPSLEMRLGRLRFAGLFLSTAAAGSAFAVILGSPTDIGVGASGAVFGMFGVWAATAYSQRSTVRGRAMLSNIWLNLAINAAIPLFVPQVSWQAHLGGFLAGLMFGAVWINTPGKKNERVHLALLAAIALASVLVVSLF